MSFAAVVAACLVALPRAAAGQASFTGLGHPAGWERTSATDVSADGSAVSGFAEGPGNASAAFRWTRQGGIQFFSGLSGPSTATRMSADGSAVVGADTLSSGPEAFRWSESEGVARLGRLAGNRSEAYDVSDDGIVVGVSSVAAHPNGEAFRWTQAGGMSSLGSLDPSRPGSEANAVSADGAVVVGSSNFGTTSRAFRWTPGGGMVALGDDPASAANGVSPDGTVVVGSRSVHPLGSEAFRWTESLGMLGLGDLPGGPVNSFARGVSADGSVVVGFGTVGPDALRDHRAFIWDPGRGMRDLREVLATELGLAEALEGWTLTFATEVSADGRFIVGHGTNPSGVQEAWVVDRLPEPGALALLAVAVPFVLRRRRR